MTHQGKPYDSVVQAIGHTPVVALSRLTRDVEGRILAKLEYLNPGFSKKDRIARQIIKAEGENGGRTAAARSDVSGNEPGW